MTIDDVLENQHVAHGDVSDPFDISAEKVGELMVYPEDAFVMSDEGRVLINFGKEWDSSQCVRVLVASGGSSRYPHSSAKFRLAYVLIDSLRLP